MLAGFTPPSMRSPDTVTPAGSSTGPPPSSAGHCAALPGRLFISLIAQTFLVYEVVLFAPSPASCPRCVSEAENQLSAGKAKAGETSSAKSAGCSAAGKARGILETF